jgi:hypothetical protein
MPSHQSIRRSLRIRRESERERGGERGERGKRERKREGGERELECAKRRV